MKKSLLALGAITVVITPMTVVIACGDDSPTTLDLTIGQVAAIGDEQLAILVADDTKGLTKAQALAKVDTLTGSADQKASLKTLINYYKNWETSWNVISFARGARGPTAELGLIAWKGYSEAKAKLSTEEEEDSAALSALQKPFFDFIKNGSADINEIGKGIIEKFTNVGTADEPASKNNKFSSLVLNVATADEKTHTLTTGVLWTLGVDAMGGTEIVRYILEHLTPKWTLVEAS
ncbi:hypothetical protein [Candidatus Mycoplasma mahonii]|uniref:hypothetical protein n=1 Tax=Candidatus Mycoplasma mahonii TaxID=3004105 RepID=UPI0026EDF676|nr:hypothetical protein [Candidatus Mycoplasma mahonii]WKX02391.1 hypothetical protein O3I44_03270 [Candidatus Mycoplasma mahonii]